MKVAIKAEEDIEPDSGSGNRRFYCRVYCEFRFTEGGLS